MPFATRPFEATCKYKRFQPVCSEPSPSRSTTTTPFPERTTSPDAAEAIQWSEDKHPVFALGGAKSKAAIGPSCSQAACGPPVNAQGSSTSKGRDNSGWLIPGGKIGPK